MGFTPMRIRNLPPLSTDTAYQASDFQWLEYSHYSRLGKGAQKSIFRLLLRNGTTIDVPIADEIAKRFVLQMVDSFGNDVIEHLKSRHWI